MCWHQHSHPTAKPCGVGHFTNIVSLPFLGCQGSQKNGKIVQQDFHSELSYYIPETELRVKNTLPFFSTSSGRLISLSIFRNPFFQVTLEFIFSENIKGLQ